MVRPDAVWDIHHHWVSEVGYIDRLLRTMDRLGIERTVLIAMGDFASGLFVQGEHARSAPDNAALSRAIRAHPDRLMGWGFVRPGHHAPDAVERIGELGLHGLKFHAPAAPYSHPDYFPTYEQAVAHGLPCLFHTGIFSPAMPGYGIRSEYCRPIHLEPLAHEFPELQMICAHLGVCWNDEAATLCRLFPNVSADLSGRVDGWRKGRSAAWFRETFFWPEAHRKIVFGSDVHADEVDETLQDHVRLFGEMGWGEDEQAAVFAGNARRLFGVG
jgi:predicted TIM-barrel fold metal-dependent hydrolase